MKSAQCSGNLTIKTTHLSVTVEVGEDRRPDGERAAVVEGEGARERNGSDGEGDGNGLHDYR